MHADVGRLQCRRDTVSDSTYIFISPPQPPAGLKLVELPRSGDWQLLRADGAIFKLFANREDAEAGLEVAKGHTQLCYIGKSNTRSNRKDYIMEY